MGGRLALGLIVAACTLATTTGSARAAAPDALFVVDTSGSMAGARIAEAKAALHTSINALTDDQPAGLRSFAGSCGDGGILRVPIGTANRDQLRTQTDALVAAGGTPTPDALRAAASDFTPGSPGTIILISDGQSGCGDPCPVAAELSSRLGVAFRVHAVGFQAPGSAETELQCIADATGGRYYSAGDADGLADAIGEALGGSLRYVALGDSYSSGEGAGAGNYFQWQETRYRCRLILGGVPRGLPRDASSPLPGHECVPYTVSHDIGCHRAPTAWSFTLALESSAISDGVENAACSGATIPENLLDKGRENEQPQVDRLEDLDGQEKVDLVTFTIGGNDVGFGDIGRACFAGNGPAYTCRNAEEGVQKELDRIDLVRPLRLLRDAAPDAVLAFVSYPQVVPDNDADVTRCRWLDGVERASLRNVVGRINLAQFKAVEVARNEGIKAVFVDITDALKGHEICTDDSHVVPVYGNPFNSEQGHPDAIDRSSTGGTSGQQDLAKAVRNRLVSLGVISR